MGIGISYTNANGVTSAFSAQGASDALAAIGALAKQSESAFATWRSKRNSSRPTSASGKSQEQMDSEREARKQKQADKNHAKFAGMTYKEWKARQAEEAGGNNPAAKKIGAVQAARDFVKKIVGFRGALEEKFGKIALRGETTARNGGMFGKSIRGVFGFFGLDAFDEPKVGRTISNALDTDEDPQAGGKKASENTPWCEDFVTRVFVTGGAQGSSETSPQFLKFGFRNRKMTAGGREFAVGDEQVVDVCKINGGNVEGDGYPGCFEVTISGSSAPYSLTFANQYYNVGGKSYEASVSGFTTEGGIVALRLDVQSSTPSAAMQTYASLSAMQTAQADKRYYIIPLYTVSGGEVTCDWRKGANAAMWEF